LESYLDWRKTKEVKPILREINHQNWNRSEVPVSVSVFKLPPPLPAAKLCLKIGASGSSSLRLHLLPFSIPLCPSHDQVPLACLARSRLFHLLSPILAVACRSWVGAGGRGRWHRHGLVHLLPPLPIASLPLLRYLRSFLCGHELRVLFGRNILVS
ncbi:hypothetical protein U1Q18_032605, partial [Sarracenia purpurea var. burkii]